MVSGLIALALLIFIHMPRKCLPIDYVDLQPRRRAALKRIAATYLQKCSAIPSAHPIFGRTPSVDKYDDCNNQKLMDFDELDQHMRVFETHTDQCVLPSIYMVARLDGRSFTRLTKEQHAFDAPFDERFRDAMIETTRHLMQCGFRVVFGYTQSDEISLLLHRDESAFQRKLRKLVSILAGEASAKFSLLLGDLGVFDCRICQLPSQELVRDYFRWRMEDAVRNALNAHCYWMLRKQGRSVGEATQRLEGMSVSGKNELLFEGGINFNDLPAWQKRGVGVCWEQIDKVGYNPVTQMSVLVQRQRLSTQLELPIKDDFARFLSALVTVAEETQHHA